MTLGSTILAEIKNDVQDAKTFFLSAAQYAGDNIRNEVVQAAKDAVLAAEQAFESDSTVDKYAHALAAATGALAKDGVQFVEADVNYAIEAVVQQRKAREDSSDVPPSESDASGASSAAEADETSAA